MSEACLYHDSESYQELLRFVVKLRNVAPFNAMILQIQKPGVTYVASSYDWWHRFERKPKQDARPLLILWPFAPVVTVYDVLDTEGKKLPEDAAMFPAKGDINEKQMSGFKLLVEKKTASVEYVDKGDSDAGRIERSIKSVKGKLLPTYRVKINQNHSPPVQFTTLAHELGHLFLGHLGPDKELSVPERRELTHSQKELEAESVAYIVCERNGVKAKSAKYLANFVKHQSTIPDLDVYQIMRAANQVETLLGLNEHTKFPSKKDRLTAVSDIQMKLLDT
ncbi:ImmA/IrrE family metallo-endopeptidase [Stieleria varia]|uniref:ImmA/IrrE family metallo-endopeptidase n=1 Tax=Stieleria varia TaxID=2528005 RepID=UPI0018D1F849|nr:ImmA/IrrE family metallo-endopeptidase [Stieleria varia]